MRPADSTDEIEKLVELVENGILKEEGNTFVVCGSEETEIQPDRLAVRLKAHLTDWEPGPGSSPAIGLSEVEEGPLTGPSFANGCENQGFRLAPADVPRFYLPLAEGSSIAWLQPGPTLGSSFRFGLLSFRLILENHGTYIPT